jgi:hypothetical protein
MPPYLKLHTLFLGRYTRRYAKNAEKTLSASSIRPLIARCAWDSAFMAFFAYMHGVPMSSTGAARQRRHRDRLAAGRVVLPVEVDETRLVAVLADTGLIGADPERSELAQVLARWSVDSKRRSPIWTAPSYF